MSLKLIYGRAGSGKSTYCLENIKERVSDKEKSPLILIVPDQFSFQASRNLTKVMGEEGLLRAEVLSFKRMAYRVFNEVGGITKLHVNSAGKSMLIYRIMDEIKNNLKVFNRAGKQQGFVNTIGDIITEMKRYNVAPESLKMATENIKANDNLKNKLEDIYLLYSSFDKMLHEKYIDTEDDLTLLADKLDRSHIFDGAEIWIDEFSSFTPQQYSIIEKLLRKAKRVNITLCSDCLNGKNKTDNTDVFFTVKNTEMKLLKMIEENNISYDKPTYLCPENGGRFEESKVLSHIEKYFFSFPYNEYRDKAENVSIFRAVNIYSEVQNTARDIVRLCRDKGVRYNQIAVVTRDLAAYQKLVQIIFSQYDIPYFVDQKRDINNNPLVILMNTVLEIFTRNWSYESMFRYLKTGLIDINREDIDLLENYVLANGLRGKKWTEEKEWIYRINFGFDEKEISEYEEETLKKINNIKQIICEPLIKFQNNIKENKKVREICTAFYDFLNDIKVNEKIEKWIEEFKNIGDNEKANEYSQIWNIIMQLLDQIVEVMGEEEIKLDQFVKVLATGFGEYKMGLIPSSLDQVLVGSVERVKSHEVSVLYILGVNDGIFPQGGSEEGILTDKDREELKLYGIEIAQDTKSKAFEEQFLIYTTLTIASKYLRISYPIADFEGKTMRPSIIISRLKKILPNLREESDVIYKNSEEENLSLISEPIPTFEELVAIIRKDIEGIEARPLWWDVYRWYMKDEKWKERCERAFDGLHYTNQVEYVNSRKIRKLYGKSLQFSVSRLEKYVECPFAYYIQHGLKAKERKIYDFSAPDMGSFIHGVLDEFSVVLEKESMTWRDIERDWCNEAISFVVDKIIGEKAGFILNSSPRYKYMADRLKRLISKSVWIISEHIKSGAFNPLGHEMSFGSGKDFPPIVIELPSGQEINLIGRIDRIDDLETEEGTYLRIIDYKSGNKEFKLSDVYYGLQIQLLVYLDAILSNKEKYLEKGVIPGAILYFKIDDPIISVDSEEAEAQIEEKIMKKLKMNGLLLNDAKIIKAMDNNIDGYSLIIPAYLKKDGTLGKSSVATLEQFETLRAYVRKTLISLCEDMLNGKIVIRPYKKKQKTPCGFCNFSAICGFDTSIEGNKYKILKDKKDDEVWRLMEESITKE